MVEVFKTNVQKGQQADTLIIELHQHFPDAKINFDLDDCDRILRIEGLYILADSVMRLLQDNGFKCRILE
ncbi:hypothetical protein GZH53_02610 [Flavihumibacter sp. R14]|nr:hypothetical protein [Flavihumibacter soli]